MKTINNILNISKINNTYIVRFNGIKKLNIINSEKVEKELQELIKVSNATLILDLQGIQFIDSTGFQLLLNMKRKVYFNNTRLVLTYIQDEVLELFNLLNLNNVFEIVRNKGINNRILKEAS